MIEVRTPSRLHFGLLAFDPYEARQFGGVGLMIRRPDTLVRLNADAPDRFTGTGLMSDRAVEFARLFMDRAMDAGLTATRLGAAIQVARVPRPHNGLGGGTQLGMAVARAMAELIERPDLGVTQLAQLVGRGKRSAIGTHGFIHGGLIVEGGKRTAGELSPMLIRMDFPAAWRVVLIRPKRLHGLSGEREQQVFDHQLLIPRELTAELCRLVLLGLAPAVAEQDLSTFGEALYELQRRVGDCFARSQGGRWADPSLAAIVEHVRKRGIPGVGQSSWGPTLYAVTEDDTTAERLAADLLATFDLEPGDVTVTMADNHGSSVSVKAAV